MARFTAAEIAYLQGQRLGRLATIDRRGELHVVPVGFRYNAEHDTIDLGGYGLATSKKYRDALAHGRAAFVVDDVPQPGKPRFVEVRGTVQAGMRDPADASDAPTAILRIIPTYIVSIGVNDEIVDPRGGRVNYHGRAVE
jgi:pyridoxamine 5'-phosphate oxidase family protein